MTIQGEYFQFTWALLYEELLKSIRKKYLKKTKKTLNSKRIKIYRGLISPLINKMKIKITTVIVFFISKPKDKEESYPLLAKTGELSYISAGKIIYCNSP